MKLAFATIGVLSCYVGSSAFVPLRRTRRVSLSTVRERGLSISQVRLAPLWMVSNDGLLQADNVLGNEDLSIVNALWNQSKHDEAALQDLVLQALPNMSSKLIMALRMQRQQPLSETPPTTATAETSDVAIQQVSMALETLLDDRLAQGREVLATLLSAGELRKLDAAIGKANRDGKLDMAFFTVLDINLKDAAAERMPNQVTVNEKDNDSPSSASRLDILTHIYTRCHEVVEASLPPGMVLLNKLLRTSAESIRVNQLQYYLCPRPDTITLPDGQVIPVNQQNGREPLVPPSLLVEALATTIQQIRTVENAGGVTREAAANMVESCRSVAKEARLVLAKEYGVNSEILAAFESGLQPVFRPSTANSTFIQGV